MVRRRSRFQTAQHRMVRIATTKRQQRMPISYSNALNHAHLLPEQFRQRPSSLLRRISGYKHEGRRVAERRLCKSRFQVLARENKQEGT